MTQDPVKLSSSATRALRFNADALDVLSGELKDRIYETQNIYSDSNDRYLDGYLNALIEVYRLTYEIWFARDEITRWRISMSKGVKGAKLGDSSATNSPIESQSEGTLGS